MKKQFSVLILFVLLLFFGAVLDVGALSPYSSDPITLGGIEGAVMRIQDFIFTIGGIIVAAMVVWSGVKWAMAGGDATKVENARAMLKAAFFGALIVGGVWVILATVNALLSGEFFGRGFFWN
jgi:hypothetical protein